MLALAALASTYATYVVTRSAFPPVERLRIAVHKRWGEGSWQAYLSRCGWCSGFWVAGLVTGATWLATDLAAPVLHWLAAAAVAGFVVTATDALERAGVPRSGRDGR